MSDTPLELRGIEARLKTLRPEQNAELVQTVRLFSKISCETPPLPPLSASAFPHFSRFIRRAQFQAGLCGLLVGLLLGITLGGLGTFLFLRGPELRSWETLHIGRISPIQLLVPELQDDLGGSVTQIIRYYKSVAEMRTDCG